MRDPFAALVNDLSKSARAAYPYLRSLSLVRPELSKTSILNQLKETDLGLRKQTAFDLIDLVRNKGDVTDFIRTFGENAIIPDSLHKLSPTGISGGNRVQYSVGTNSKNPLIPEFINVNARAGLNANQIYGAASASFRYEEGSGMAATDLSDVVFTIDDARFAPGEQVAGDFNE